MGFSRHGVGPARGGPEEGDGRRDRRRHVCAQRGVPGRDRAGRGYERRAGTVRCGSGAPARRRILNAVAGDHVKGARQESANNDGAGAGCVEVRLAARARRRRHRAPHRAHALRAPVNGASSRRKNAEPDLSTADVTEIKPHRKDHAPRGLFVALLLTLATLLAVPEQAAAQQPPAHSAYMSNFGEGSTVNLTVGKTSHHAMKFATGSRQGGCPLGSIGLKATSSESNFDNFFISTPPLHSAGGYSCGHRHGAP